MGSSLPPGPGENRRTSPIERFLAKLTRRRIFAEDEFGITRQYEILAHIGPERESAIVAPSAFFGVTKEKGKWMLQGGQVVAGNKSEVVKPIELAKVGSEPSDNQLHWIQITGDGLVTAGRLQGTFNMTKVTTGKGTTMPPLTLPTKDTPKGRDCFVLLGSWQGKKFQPSQAGYVGITFCPGQGYTIHRGS